MAITTSLNRPLANPTQALTPTLDIGAPVETDGAEEHFIVPITETLNPPSFTVANCTTTNANANVTATGGAFNTAKVKVGDAVTGTGIAASTTVTAVATNGNSLTLSNNATASGTVTLTFDPPSASYALAWVKIAFVKEGQFLTLRPTMYEFREKKASDATLNNSSASNTFRDLGLRIDYDAWLSANRVLRS